MNSLSYRNVLKRIYTFLFFNNSDVNSYPLPYVHIKLRTRQIGRSYLSDLLTSRPLVQTARKMTVRSELVVDLFSACLFAVKCPDQLKTGSQTAADPADCLYIPNRCVMRLLDIASYHNINITIIASGNASEADIRRLLDKFELPADKLLLTDGTRQTSAAIITELARPDTCVISGLSSHIRIARKQQALPLYYEPPHALMKRIKHPDLTASFQGIYDSICATELWYREHCFSPAYEIAYLCLGPALYGYIQYLQQYRETAALLLCNDDAGIFAWIYQQLHGPLHAVSWTAADKSAPADTAHITGLIDQLTGPAGNLIIISPLPGPMYHTDFCCWLEKIRPAITCTCVSMNDYLDCSGTALTQLTRVLCDRQHCFRPLHSAMTDFCRAFSRYQKHHDPAFTIPAQDAARLYFYAEPQLEEILNTLEGTL